MTFNDNTKFVTKTVYHVRTRRYNRSSGLQPHHIQTKKLQPNSQTNAVQWTGETPHARYLVLTCLWVPPWSSNHRLLWASRGPFFKQKIIDSILFLFKAFFFLKLNVFFVNFFAVWAQIPGRDEKVIDRNCLRRNQWFSTWHVLFLMKFIHHHVILWWASI